MVQISLTSIKGKWTVKLLREAVYENEGIDTYSNLLIYKVKYSLHFMWMILSKELIFWAMRIFI